MRTLSGGAGSALEGRTERDGRDGRRREHADGGDQEACGVSPTVLQGDVPGARVFLIVCSGYPALALDVTTQIELVGDVIQIALGLRLRGEVFFPVPFVEQFLRKGITVGPAFRIEARAGIAVPIAAAADTGAGFEYAQLEPEI